jgi:hypothetical protein
MKANSATVISGMALLAPSSIGLFLTGIPTVFAPLPTLTVLPAFALSSCHLGIFAITIPSLLFFVWNPGLLKGTDRIPQRTYALLVVVVTLDAMWFVGGWRYGLQYQGPLYTRAVCALNVLWIALLGLMCVRSLRKEPSFKANLAFHWVFFAWLAWYAFPYLGELP